MMAHAHLIGWTSIQQETSKRGLFITKEEITTDSTQRICQTSFSGMPTIRCQTIRIYGKHPIICKDSSQPVMTMTSVGRSSQRRIKRSHPLALSDPSWSPVTSPLLRGSCDPLRVRQAENLVRRNLQDWQASPVRHLCPKSDLSHQRSYCTRNSLERFNSCCDASWLRPRKRVSDYFMMVLIPAVKLLSVTLQVPETLDRKFPISRLSKPG